MRYYLLLLGIILISKVIYKIYINCRKTLLAKVIKILHQEVHPDSNSSQVEKQYYFSCYK